MLKTLYSFTLDSPSLGGPYSLVQQVLDFAPGSQTVKHRHGGPGVITVLQGQVTLNATGQRRSTTWETASARLPARRCRHSTAEAPS